MITPFEQVWEYTDKVLGSFTRISAEKYYEYALQSDGVMVEVGVDQGRSASILMMAARHTGASVLLVDSWESVLIVNMAKVSNRLHQDFPDVAWQIYNRRSVDASTQINGPLSFVHIDAGHYDDDPGNDCLAWLPKLRPSGIACFHDYNSCFPAVTPAVDKHTAGWEDLGNWDGLAIRRKPC